MKMIRVTDEHLGVCQEIAHAFEEVHPEAAADIVARLLARKEREALTSYIIASAGQYSHGMWTGEGVAEDMLRGAGITRDEIREHEHDPARRKRLLAMVPVQL